MSSACETESILGSYRVLDLTDETGDFCGKMLGDLGADVLKVEPPGGEPSRNIGPFYHDIQDPEKSLRWFAFNTSKRGITLDIESAAGREIFKKLVKTADFILETFKPGYLDSLGLGYSTLSQINPRLIMTSITPFGQTGPYSEYKGSDIVVSAMGGLMNIQGDPDRAPLRAAAEQAYLQGSLQAAVGTFAAHYEREFSGLGQFVDVALQEAMVWTIDNSAVSWDLAEVVVGRHGSKRLATDLLVDCVFQSKDGHIAVIPVMGGEVGITLFEWIKKQWITDGLTEGEIAILEADWGDPLELTQEMTQGIIDNRERIAADFFRTMSTADLMMAAQEKGLELTAMCTPEDFVSDIQLESRNYFAKVVHPELDDTLTYLGSPYKMSETPWQIWRRAPLIGEHNLEIYQGELKFTDEEFLRLKEEGVI